MCSPTIASDRSAQLMEATGDDEQAQRAQESWTTSSSNVVETTESDAGNNYMPTQAHQYAELERYDSSESDNEGMNDLELLESRPDIMFGDDEEGKDEAELLTSGSERQATTHTSHIEDTTDTAVNSRIDTAHPVQSSTQKTSHSKTVIPSLTQMPPIDHITIDASLIEKGKTAEQLQAMSDDDIFLTAHPDDIQGPVAVRLAETMSNADMANRINALRIAKGMKVLLTNSVLKRWSNHFKGTKEEKDAFMKSRPRWEAQDPNIRLRVYTIINQEPAVAAAIPQLLDRTQSVSRAQELNAGLHYLASNPILKDATTGELLPTPNLIELLRARLWPPSVSLTTVEGDRGTSQQALSSLPAAPSIPPASVTLLPIHRVAPTSDGQGSAVPAQTRLPIPSLAELRQRDHRQEQEHQKCLDRIEGILSGRSSHTGRA